jgi:hypothetical protein
VWIPSTAAEVVASAAAASLCESSTLDAKLELPPQRKNIDIAIDIAAMANEGGVLLYGLGEAANKQLTVVNPIVLAGAVQRIDQIAQHGIQPPLRPEIRPLATDADPTRGFISVIVDASDEAPHMVVTAKENRFYGRTSSGNAPLTETQIAELYGRRGHTAQDTAAALKRFIARALFDQRLVLSRLDIMIRPTHSRQALVHQAAAGSHPPVLLGELVNGARQPEVRKPRREEAPRWETLGDPHAWRQGTNGWHVRTEAGMVPDDIHLRPRGSLGRYLHYLAVEDDGTLYLAWGGATYEYNDRLVIDTDRVAEYVVRALWIAGQLYSRASYLGSAVAAVQLGPILGAVDAIIFGFTYGLGPLYPAEDTYYHKGVTVPARTLPVRVTDVARELVQPLARSLTQGKVDPFA